MTAGPTWPPAFHRIPDEPWVEEPVDALAVGYDAVRQHGWYANLGPTVEELAHRLDDGDIIIDYSGGTGILEEQLLGSTKARFGVCIVDSSPKFLRLAVEKFRHDERIAVRRILYLKQQKRLQLLHEVLGKPLLDRGADGIVSTNAIHLYYDLDDTLTAWRDCLRDDAFVLVQSGNIGPASNNRWIIDETVHAMAQAAQKIVQEDNTYAQYRDTLADEARMQQYHDLRCKYFLPVRKLQHYIDACEQAGLTVENVETRSIPARVEEWLQFLSVYHEGILGWVGGAEKIEGRPASEQDIQARQELLQKAAARVFSGRSSFDAQWTYLQARAA